MKINKFFKAVAATFDKTEPDLLTCVLCLIMTVATFKLGIALFVLAFSASVVMAFFMAVGMIGVNGAIAYGCWILAGKIVKWWRT